MAYQDLYWLFKWIPWLIRKSGLQSLLRINRNWVIRAPVSVLHEYLIRAITKMEIARESGDDERMGDAATEACNAFKKIICTIMELPQNQLNCTIKSLSYDEHDVDQNGPIQVTTYSYSTPDDNRHHYLCVNDSGIEKKKESPFPKKSGLVDHSAGKAILGIGDTWKQPYACFACNNLPTQQRFECPRDNWKNYYSSLLVFPIFTKAEERSLAGFLCVDSPTENAFRGMPCSFSGLTAAEFKDKLDQQMCYHMCCVFAELLAFPLRSLETKVVSSKNGS